MGPVGDKLHNPGSVWEVSAPGGIMSVWDRVAKREPEENRVYVCADQ